MLGWLRPTVTFIIKTLCFVISDETDPEVTSDLHYPPLYNRLGIVQNYQNVYAFVFVSNVTSNRASNGPGYDCVAECEQTFRLPVYTAALRIVMFFLEELQLSGRVEDLD